MSRIETLFLDLGIALLIAGIGAAAVRWKQPRSLLTVGLGATLALLVVTIWERNLHAGTPFAFQEPIWFTLLVRIIPMALVLLTVRSAHTKGLAMGWQIVLGAVGGVLSIYVTVLLLYLALGFI